MNVRRLFQSSLFAALIAAPLGAQMTFVPDQTRSLSVTGYGSVTSHPDVAAVKLGVFAIETDVGKAKDAVNLVVNRLLALAAKLNITKEDLFTASIYISPQYMDGDPSKFRGYEVTRSVNLTVHDLTVLPRLLDGAVEAGANRDFDITLKSSREPDLKKQATAVAIDNARAQPDFPADRLPSGSGPIRSISFDKRP